MTTFPRIRGVRASRTPVAISRSAVLGFLIVPAVIGWLLFVALDISPGLFPQEIRISQSATADGSTWAEYDPYMDDFVVFYAAGSLARTNVDSIYDLDAVHEEQARLLASETKAVIRLPFFNPPQYLLPLAIISLLAMGPAAALWTIGGLVVFVLALTWLLAGRKQSLQRTALASSALIVSMPFHEVILHGQMTFVLFGALAAIYAGAIRADRPWLAAAGLAALAVKPQFVIVPILYLLVTKQLGSLWRFALIEAGLTAVTVATYGVDIYGQWLSLAWGAVAWEDANGVWIHAMFGWNAFVRALIGSEHALLRAALSLALSAVTVAFVVPRWRQGTRLSGPRTFATIVFAGLLLSPHLFAQDLLLAGVALLALLSDGDDRSRVTWAVYGAVGWALTFWHFGPLLPDPSQQGLNLVTLWLAAGLGMAAFPQFVGMPRPFRTRTCPAVRAAEELV